MLAQEEQRIEDWADMLRRMYIKWFDKKNLNTKLLVNIEEKKLE